MANTTGQKFGGRTKGTPNKMTNALREKFQTLLDDNLDKMQSDLDALEPKERLKTLLELANYVLPKLRTIDVNEIGNDEDNEAFRPVIINLGTGKEPEHENEAV
jgi:hypothetical protein